MKNNKGFAPIAIVLIIIVVLAVGGVAYFAGKSSKPLPQNVVENNLPPENQNNVTTPPVQNTQVNNVVNNTQTDCLPNTAPWIKVLSPNGGETYTVGQQITVKWKSCNIKSNNVALGLKNITTGNESFQLTAPDNGKADFDFQGFPVGNYKIIICNTKPVSGKFEVSYNRDCSVSDYSDSLFTLNINQSTVNLSTFSSQYVTPYPGQWPPIVQHNDTTYSCSTISRDVFGTPTTLTGTQKNINGRKFCIYSFSDGGAGHFAGVYTYITAELNGSGTERVDFRVDWGSCGVYGTTGDPQYDQCKNDQSTFFNNLDAYIASLM